MICICGLGVTRWSTRCWSEISFLWDVDTLLSVSGCLSIELHPRQVTSIIENEISDTHNGDDEWQPKWGPQTRAEYKSTHFVDEIGFVSPAYHNQKQENELQIPQMKKSWHSYLHIRDSWYCLSSTLRSSISSPASYFAPVAFSLLLGRKKNSLKCLHTIWGREHGEVLRNKKIWNFSLCHAVLLCHP